MKTTKISVTYCNSANIPDGLQYGGIKPFYSITQEIEVTPAEDTNLAKIANINRLKAIVDSYLLQDMKNWKDLRRKCTCQPFYDNEKKQYIHGEICLMGTGG